MNALRKHCYDLGGLFAIIVMIFIAVKFRDLTRYELLMWLSLVSLFVHQLEEYRFAGTFPGMLNTVMHKSELPDRNPLNTNTALLINVILGWGLYLSAALYAEKALRLGITSMMVTLGNIIAHLFVFNIKGKTFYNAGMFTSLFLFVPCFYFFVMILKNDHLVSVPDLLIGIPLGITVNIAGILKMIDWLADKKSIYIFDQRNLLPKRNRIKSSVPPSYTPANKISFRVNNCSPKTYICLS